MVAGAPASPASAAKAEAPTQRAPRPASRTSSCSGLGGRVGPVLHHRRAGRDRRAATRARGCRRTPTATSGPAAVGQLDGLDDAGHGAHVEVRTSSPPTSLPRSISTTPNSRSAGQAGADQRSVARLEHVQRQAGGRHQDRPRAGTWAWADQPSSITGHDRPRPPAASPTCCWTPEDVRRQLGADGHVDDEGERERSGRRRRRHRPSADTEDSEPVLARRTPCNAVPTKRSARVPVSPATARPSREERSGPRPRQHVDERGAGDAVVEREAGAVGDHDAVQIDAAVVDEVEDGGRTGDGRRLGARDLGEQQLGGGCRRCSRSTRPTTSRTEASPRVGRRSGCRRPAPRGRRWRSGASPSTRARGAPPPGGRSGTRGPRPRGRSLPGAAPRAPRGRPWRRTVGERDGRGRRRRRRRRQTWSWRRGWSTTIGRRRGRLVARVPLRHGRSDEQHHRGHGEQQPPAPASHVRPRALRWRA